MRAPTPFSGARIRRSIRTAASASISTAAHQEIVRQVLLLPGLSQVIDLDTGRPQKLEKRWGAVCMKYPMQFQCARRLNLHPLHLVLPIKPPIKENAARLLALTVAGAPLIEEALDKRKHVHSAYFMLVEGGTHLAMMTIYDGDFDAYVEHFAIDVPLFDEQLKYLEGAPPTPTRQHPKEFVEWIRKHNQAPFGGFLQRLSDPHGVRYRKREVSPVTIEWNEQQKGEVQRLALRGFDSMPVANSYSKSKTHRGPANSSASCFARGLGGL
jgi:hypothetical protein